MKRLIRKGMALWLALALAASMLPAGFAAGEGSSSSDAGSAQSAEKADDTNLPYEYELDEDGNATLTKYTGSETEVVTPKTIDGNKHPGLEREKGYICFCGHGAKVSFRNIKLKELK